MDAGAFRTGVSLAPAVASVGVGKQAAIAVQATIPEWQATQNGAPYLMAAQSAALPSLIIYDTGLEALPIGGFDGSTPSPTLAQLQADIRHGLFHLVWIDSDTDPRLRWITTHCTQISKRFFNCMPAHAGSVAAVLPRMTSPGGGLEVSPAPEGRR